MVETETQSSKAKPTHLKQLLGHEVFEGNREEV
jgi:hypothetical protein